MKRVTLTSAYFTLVTLLLSFGNLMAQTVNIKGTTKDIPDSTWLYLLPTLANAQLDSTQVFDGRFTFQGRLEEDAAQFVIHTKGHEDYVFFWVESKPIEIHLEKGKFKEASIKGSDTQAENSQLHAAESIRQQDSILSALDQETDSLKRAVLVKEYRSLDTRVQRTYTDHIAQHPNSWVSIHLLNVYKSKWGQELTRQLFDQLSDRMQSTSYGKTVKNFLSLSASKNHEIGDKYTDFEQANTDGKPIKLSDIKGKYVLVDFWASWCIPCRQENPNLVAAYKEFRPKGFEILGVSLDEKEEHWKKAIQDDGLIWEQVSDLKGRDNEAAMIYLINSIPSNFLIDENGTIIAKNLRGEALDRKLQELFGK